jgi:hypothetical protein
MSPQENKSPVQASQKHPDLPSAPLWLIIAIFFLIFFGLILVILIYQASLLACPSNTSPIKLSRHHRETHESLRSSSEYDGGNDALCPTSTLAVSSAVATPITPTFSNRGPDSSIQTLTQRFLDASCGTHPTKRAPVENSDEESLLAQHCPSNPKESAHQKKTWLCQEKLSKGFGNITWKTAARLADWAQGSAGEDDLILPVTEKQRNGSVDY